MDKKSTNLFKRIRKGFGHVKEEIATVQYSAGPPDRVSSSDLHHPHREFEFESDPLISTADMAVLAQSIDQLNRVCFCEYEVKNVFKRTKNEVEAIVLLHKPHVHDDIFERVLQEEMEMLARTVHRNQNGHFTLVNCMHEDERETKDEYEDEGFMSWMGSWLRQLCTPWTNNKD